MQTKLGVIGCGNMGGAIVEGCLKSPLFHADNFYIFDKNEQKREHMKQSYSIKTCLSESEVYEASDYILLAIKPHQFEECLKQIEAIYQKNKVIISIAAGISIAQIQAHLKQPEAKVIRVMPNTPSLVLEGACGICQSSSVKDSQSEYVELMFETLGLCEYVQEAQMDAVVALSGSSPAYAFMMLEAMIAKGQELGVSYEQSKRFAAQSLRGAATMVMKSELSASQLRDNVCSPNGTTIEAVHKLEALKFEETIKQAMEACFQKSKQMSNQ